MSQETTTIAALEVVPESYVAGGEIHLLKCYPEQFQALLDGLKGFEWRRDDRDPPFKEGDILIVREWNTDLEVQDRFRYTGRICFLCVRYIIRGPKFGIPEGFCIMSVVPWTGKTEAAVRLPEPIGGFSQRIDRLEETRR